MTEGQALNLPDEGEFNRQSGICFNVVQNAVVMKMMQRGLHPFAIANALLSHAATLFSVYDGLQGTAEHLEEAAQALRDLDKSESTPAGQKH